MDARLVRRAAATIGALALAVAVAAGCGGASKGAGKAAASGGPLEYVPAGALFYLTVDADFDGDGWKQAEEHAKQFQGYTEQRDKALESMFKDSDVKWADIKPWLGDSIGVGAWQDAAGSKSKPTADNDSMAMSSADDSHFVGWAEIEDKAKAEKFLKDQKSKKDGSSGDFTFYTDAESKDTDGYMALGDDIMLFGETKADLEKAIKAKDNDSVLDDEGTKDVAGEIEDDALVAVVLSGTGTRAAIKDGAPGATQELLGIKEVKAFKGLSFGISAEDEGFLLSGFAGFDGDKLGGDLPGADEFEPTLLQDLPGDTSVAFTAGDFGAQLKDAVDALSKQNKQAAQGKSQIEAVLGVTLDDVAKAYGGQFALAVGSKKAPAQGAAGIAAMVPPISLVTETKDEAKARTVTDKLIGLTQLAGTPPKDTTVGEMKVKEASVGGFTVAAATHDGHSFVTTDTGFLSAFGGDATLGDSATFKDAWEAADAPDKVGGALYADVQKLIELFAGLSPSGGQIPADTKPLGPWVAWADSEDDSVSFDVFMQINEGSAKS